MILISHDTRHIVFCPEGFCLIRSRYMGIIINLTFPCVYQELSWVIFSNNFTVGHQNIETCFNDYNFTKDMFMMRANSLAGPGGSLRGRSSLLTEMTSMSSSLKINLNVDIGFSHGQRR